MIIFWFIVIHNVVHTHTLRAKMNKIRTMYTPFLPRGRQHTSVLTEFITHNTVITIKTNIITNTTGCSASNTDPNSRQFMVAVAVTVVVPVDVALLVAPVAVSASAASNTRYT